MIYQVFIKQSQQTSHISQLSELKIKTEKAVEQLSGLIAGGGFNPRHIPFATDLADNSAFKKKINFFCLGKDKLYFASDRGSGSFSGFLENDYNGLIDQPASCTIANPVDCGATSVCPMDEANPKETSLLEFRADPKDCSPAGNQCTLALYRNAEPGSTRPEGVPMLTGIVRGRFEYLHIIRKTI